MLKKDKRKDRESLIQAEGAATPLVFFFPLLLGQEADDEVYDCHGDRQKPIQRAGYRKHLPDRHIYM